MHPSFLPSMSYWIIAFILILAPTSLLANDAKFSSCSSLIRCGKFRHIGYPFWGLDRPEICGYPGFELNCNEDVLEITIMSVTYRVINIDLLRQILQVARIDYTDNICPKHLINSTFGSNLFEHNMKTQDIRLYYGCDPNSGLENLTSIHGISDQFECSINGTNIVGYYITRNTGTLATFISGLFGSCNNSVIIPVLNSEVESLEAKRDSSTLNEVLRVGFELKWYPNSSLCVTCLGSGGSCGYNLTLGEFICYCSDGSYPQLCPSRLTGSDRLVRVVLGLTSAAAIAIVVVCIIYFFLLRFKEKLRDSILSNRIPIHPWQRNMDNNASVEASITEFGSLAPRQYFYADIKKMTTKFKDKLGQGGYGSVYKGKLPDGRFVAVKVLSESKGNGMDFMNEIASIGGTSHVNIVTLLGFCNEKSRRALIYEFMPHGSLDKYIYKQRSRDQSRSLEWKTLYDIAVGIARGLEYLHQGCNTRILHFDIKPHNILLDDNFCPKISDFGLSKLCERKESIISMTGARGTAGYIAPEVFCRNFGGVSHKSDVYSYGMMVMEMVGGRKNIDAQVSKTSEIYFPSWIYKHLDQDMNLSLDGVTKAEEEEIKRKLIVVSLWCIQTNPIDRPSMTKVMEMLQGSVQTLVIPPSPFLFSPVRSPEIASTT